MGLYDYVYCKYPLPHPTMQDRQFQTKDIGDPYMNQYEITVDGRLVDTSKRPIDLSDYHGDMFMYDFAEPGKYDNLVTYRVRFTDGRVSRVDLVEGTPPDEGEGRAGEWVCIYCACPNKGERCNVCQRTRKEAEASR